MSLDFFYDAIDIMEKSGHPFVLICAPEGTRNVHVGKAEVVLENMHSADKIMQGMDSMYELLYERFEITEEGFDEDEED